MMLKPIAMIVCCLLLLAGCNMVNRGLNPSPPQGAQEAAIKAINQSLECKIAVKGCKDIRIICSGTVELSNADKANGVTEKWCMTIGFLYGDQNKWNDAVADAALSNKRGTWNAEFLGSQFKECTCKNH